MNPANAPSATTGLFQGHISAVPHSSAPRPVVSQSALNTSPVHSAVHHPLALSYSAPFAAPPPFEGIVDFTSSHAPTSGAAYPTHGNQYPTVQAPMPLAARTDSVDWKQSPFFTYRPNEVKHRKRTTRQQLKVLEDTFHKTQKPDGNVRKALALQLNMTPRNVQVWFQNRRAKDKNMAKRASKLVEEDSHATLESTSPTTPIPKAEASSAFSERSFEQCIDFVSSPNEYRHEFSFAPSSTASSSPATAHPDLNGSTSPVEEMFNRKFEISSPPAISNGFPQAVSGSNIPSTVAHAGFSVEEVASQPIALPRNIFAPRKSLPHIRAPAFGQDLQHQRSTSTPSFIHNVDNTSDLSLTTCASIDGVLSMYPPNNGQSVYGSRYPVHDRVRRMPSGPLPTANYSFGMASSQQPARETEHEFDPTSFGRYAQFNTVSGSNTPTSVSGFSQYQSVADSFEEDHAQAPYGWYPGRRGSSSQHIPSREFSPVSNGYSSGSPRPGTEPSTEPETEAHDGAVYMTGRNEWSAYTEEYKSNVATSPENKQPIGYQEIFGYNGMPITSEDGYLMAQTVANSAVYQPMMNGHSFVQQVPYTSDNQTSMVGFQSTAPVGYNYA